MLQRHVLVNDTLVDEILCCVNSVNIIAKTPSEWLEEKKMKKFQNIMDFLNSKPRNRTS